MRTINEEFEVFFEGAEHRAAHEETRALLTLIFVEAKRRHLDKGLGMMLLRTLLGCGNPNLTPFLFGDKKAFRLFNPNAEIWEFSTHRFVASALEAEATFIKFWQLVGECADQIDQFAEWYGVGTRSIMSSRFNRANLKHTLNDCDRRNGVES